MTPWEIWLLACGIIYSVAWSISFYGQIYENWKYKSIAGFNLNYHVLNVSGYIFYGFYSTLGYFFHVRGAGTVVVSDLIFVYHALLMVAVLTVQVFIYPNSKNNRVSPIVIALSIGLWLFVMTEILLSGLLKIVDFYEYFNPLLCMGYCKILIGFLKYTPPVYYNYKRKSTKGWSIWNIVFDLIGGIFSFASGSMEVGDGLNIIKLILAILTVFYDLIFIIQHYFLYPHSDTKDFDNSKEQRLLQEPTYNDIPVKPATSLENQEQTPGTVLAEEEPVGNVQ